MRNVILSLMLDALLLLYVAWIGVHNRGTIVGWIATGFVLFMCYVSIKAIREI